MDASDFLDRLLKETKYIIIPDFAKEDHLYCRITDKFDNQPENLI